MIRFPLDYPDVNKKNHEIRIKIIWDVEKIDFVGGDPIGEDLRGGQVKMAIS